MKKQLSFLLSILFCVGISAQTATNFITIKLHKNRLSGTCNLSNADTVYIHSGVGTSSATAAWESIVGNWGHDDGIGKMNKDNDSTYSICINIPVYYSSLALPDSLHGGQGTGPMPAGAKAYNIGCVFREQGPCGKLSCRKGADFACHDIFITDLPSGSPQVTDQVGDPFDAVEAVFVSACGGSTTNGILDPKQIATGISISPNPFATHAIISFTIADDSKAAIYDVNGRVISDLGSYKAGSHAIQWAGMDATGRDLPSGVYILILSDGTTQHHQKLVKL